MGDITVNGTSAVSNPAVHAGDGVAQQAQTDLGVAISNFGLDGSGTSLSASSYDTTNGQTLLPGVYSTGSTLEVSGTLNLNFNDQTNALFIFLVGSSLTVDGSSTVVLENVAPGDGIFWVMSAGSATLGTDAAFEGNILASASITLDTGANIDCGRALASTGQVSLDTNTVSTTCSNAPVFTNPPGSTATGNAFLEASNGLDGSPVPEPGALSLVGTPWGYPCDAAANRAFLNALHRQLLGPPRFSCPPRKADTALRDLNLRASKI